tara:strand:+ start:136 stop:585 length:450 start_codon:yes stop_codon:yes gene_type:complete
MIIECVNCSKKFEVNSELIPNEGRTIQCGSCNHTWFFNKNFQHQSNIHEDKVEIKPETSNDESQIDKFIETKENFKKTRDNKSDVKKSTFRLSKLLSYILVFIISFIALIIILDTFRNFLYQIFPGLELILFSLFETIKDIKLFIIDLF